MISVCCHKCQGKYIYTILNRSHHLGKVKLKNDLGEELMLLSYPYSYGSHWGSANMKDISNQAWIHYTNHTVADNINHVF